MAVAPANFYATTGAAVALVASTAKTIIGVKSAANRLVKITEVGFSFDATDATKAPVLCELASCTWASNAPGTNSTSITPVLVSGQGTVQGTAGRAWTTEPTVLTVFSESQVDSNKGMFVWQFPLGREPEAYNGVGFALRCTSGAGSTPNVRAWIAWEE